MFAKGYVQTVEHQRKAKESRNIKFGSGVCIGCGIEFQRYSSSQVVCGEKECSYVGKRARYEKLKSSDPIIAKSMTLFGSIRLGKGKKQVAIDILSQAIGSPCVYCGTEITLENASVDHKEPRTNTRLWRKKPTYRNPRYVPYTSEEIKLLDAPANIQIICRRCNGQKGDFSDREYRSLLDFLLNKPEMKRKMEIRFKMTRAFFKGQ